MEHYVTLFDSLFLPQGLSLHASMERHCGEYTLWILCMDDDAFSVLLKLNLPNIKLLPLDKLETEELKKIKPTRSKGEYCWTLTPFTPRFVFEADKNVSRVTYLDADIWFRKSPKQIFEEFETSGMHVMITDHAYLPEYDFSAETGQYCVQFMIFKRNEGDVVRQWWETHCVEWCFAKYEDGKFGDQKYLDDWPDRFKDKVHVLQQQHLLLAPWNATKFAYGHSIAYHFHGLRLIRNQQVLLAPSYPLPKQLVKHVYKPYVTDFKESISRLKMNGWIAKEQAKAPGFFQKLISPIRMVNRNFWRYLTHHVMEI